MDIKNLEIDFKNPKLIRSAIGAVVFLGITYVYFFTGVFPFCYRNLSGEIVQKEERAKKLSVKVIEAKRASENLRRLEKEVAELHRKWDVAVACLPEKKEIASLLRRVTLAGERSGVRFRLFEPQEIQYHGVYDEHPVSVKIEGGYHEIGSFFGRLNDMSRIVQVSGISLKAEKNDEDENVVRGEMTISAFTVPTAPAAQEASAAWKGSSGAKVDRKRIRGTRHGSRNIPVDSDE